MSSPTQPSSQGPSSAPVASAPAPSVPVGNVETVEAKISALKAILDQTKTTNNKFNTDVTSKLVAITQKLQSLKSLVAPIVEQAKVCAGTKAELDKKVEELTKKAENNQAASTTQMNDLKELITLATEVSKSVNVDAINGEIKALENEVEELTKVVGAEGPALPPGAGVSANTRIQGASRTPEFKPSSNVNLATKTGAPEFKPGAVKGGKKHNKTKKRRGGFTYKKKRSTRRKR